jgi:hypothetical protein
MIYYFSNVFLFVLRGKVVPGHGQLHGRNKKKSLNLYAVFEKAVSTQDVTNPVSLSSLYCMYDIPLLLHSM